MHFKLAEKIVREYEKYLINDDYNEEELARKLAGYELLLFHPCFMLLLDKYIADAIEEAIDMSRDILLSMGFNPEEMLRSLKDEIVAEA